MQTRPTISLLITAVSVVMTSCNDLNNSSPSFNQSVVCNLTVNATTQRLYLFRTTSVDDPGPVPNYFFYFPGLSLNDLRFIPYFIDHATVSVRDEPENEFPFDFTVDSLNGVIVGKSYENGQTFSVQPGNRYQLSAPTPFGTITGSTTTPGDFSLISPSPNQEYSQPATVSVRWTKSLNAAGYAIKASVVGRTFNEPPFLLATIRDTTYSINFDPETRISGSVTIQVFAYDKNYDDHRSKGVQSAGVTGAYGCFGSSVLKTVRIRVQ